MLITFECQSKGCSPRRWIGTLKLIKIGNPCEAEVSARGSRFHLIAGKHAYGNYICIPNWDIGTELAVLTDNFWNEERLRNHSKLKKADICTVVAALNVLTEYINVFCKTFLEKNAELFGEFCISKLEKIAEVPVGHFLPTGYQCRHS